MYTVKHIEEMLDVMGLTYLGALNPKALDLLGTCIQDALVNEYYKGYQDGRSYGYNEGRAECEDEDETNS